MSWSKGKQKVQLVLLRTVEFILVFSKPSSTICHRFHSFLSSPYKYTGKANVGVVIHGAIQWNHTPCQNVEIWDTDYIVSHRKVTLPEWPDRTFSFQCPGRIFSILCHLHLFDVLSFTGIILTSDHVPVLVPNVCLRILRSSDPSENCRHSELYSNYSNEWPCPSPSTQCLSRSDPSETCRRSDHLTVAYRMTRSYIFSSVQVALLRCPGRMFSIPWTTAAFRRSGL